MAGARRKQFAAATLKPASLVSELGSPLTRSEKLDRDPWLDRLDRLEAKLDARFDEVKKLLQELFGNSREEEAGVEEEEEEEIAIDKAEKEEEDEASVVIEEEEEEEEEPDMEPASNLNINQSESPAAAAVPHGSGGGGDDEKPAPPAPAVGFFELFRFAGGLGLVLMAIGTVGRVVHGCSLPVFLRFFADLGPFQALISQLMSAANDQNSQAEFPFNLCCECHPDALALLLHKQLALQCSSGVCKNVLKRLGLQIVVEMGMTMEVGDDGLPMPPPRPPPEPPPEPPPRT